MPKDLHKKYYYHFRALIDDDGLLREETTYRIKMKDSEILDTQGQRHVEFLDITFRKGAHIDLVRRGMWRWLRPYIPDGVTANSVWMKLGYSELVEW